MSKENNVLRMSSESLERISNYPISEEDQGYFVIKNIPIWRNEDGTIEKYNHQDNDFSNLCGERHCKCMQ